ncbi:MAG TPA: hypothetical protein VJ777_19930 [Mycobacterium sp.]|nr:hypothetical protein [Mycobacterium sp.]
MPETPVGPTEDGARQDVARLAELFRQSFAALDADARAAGRRWAREIDRELGSIGEVGLRADTRKVLSDIRSLDNELNRDRSPNIGADLHAGSALGDVPGSGGGGGMLPLAEAITAASTAAGGLAAAVGGVVGVVGALGNAAGQMRDSGWRPGGSSAASVPDVTRSIGAIPTSDAVGHGASPDLSAPVGISGVSDASPAPGALSGLTALADGLSRIGAAGVPGNVTVVPRSSPSASGSQRVADAGRDGLPDMPSTAAVGFPPPPIADPGSLAGGSSGGGPMLQAPPTPSTSAGPGLDAGLSGLGDAFNRVRGLSGGLPAGDPGGAVPSLSLPTPPAGIGGGLPSLGSDRGGTAVPNPGVGMPGVNPLSATNGSSYPPSMPWSAASAGTGGGADVITPPGLGGGGPANAFGRGAGGTLSSGRIAMGGDGQERVANNARRSTAQGAETIQSGPLELFGFNGPAGGDPMASAPVGPAEMSPNMPIGGDGNQLSLLGALFPGFAGVTNNQSSATFNINGGGNQPGMDVFMSFWREFGRIGGLVGAVGSFLQ